MNIYNILEMNINDNTLKNIKEFNNILNKYDYSIIDLDGNYIKDISKYKTLSPLQFQKYKCGICWDYVSYEYYYFKQIFSNINIKSFYFAKVKIIKFSQHIHFYYFI